MQLFCIGSESCSSAVANETIIKGVENIYLIGTNSIAGATIYSSSALDETDNEMNIFINGTNANDEINIYCNETNVCNIKCADAGSCENINLECMGTCNIECNDASDCDTIDCISQNCNSTNVPEPTGNDDDGAIASKQLKWTAFVLAQIFMLVVIKSS